MTLKKVIVSELGAAELLAPERIAGSLVANDQAKYYFALLQGARANADRPQVPAVTLRAERLASQVPDAWLDDVVAGTHRADADAYSVPQGGEILRRIRAAVGTMLDCLPNEERKAFAARLDAMEVPALDGTAILGSVIDAIASGDRRAGDSLHLIVMDAHRAINRLQAAVAEETLAGARVHGLSPGGRRRVEAFMAGLNRTAPLKFNHPGLGTTATELGGVLLIQNDIGTTDAHVLVLRVAGLAATLTYTDIHRQRLRFFQSLFDAFSVAWEGADERHSETLASGTYLLTTGTYAAADEDDLQRYLSHLGSRVVYLIDWNRMRKRLRLFVSKKAAIGVLRWAAEHDHGHRGLLEVGGERLLAQAVEYAAGHELRYGQRLDQLLPEERAADFLRQAMQLASTGLRQRRSHRVIGDEIKARLRGFFENARLGIFDTAAAHVAGGFDLALALREALEHVGRAGGAAWVAGFARRAGALEARADQLLNEAREDIKRLGRPASLLRFFESADDAVDELEEAADLVDLACLLEPPPAALAKLRDLADLSLMSAQELVKCVECAASVTRSDVRDDVDEFLVALEHLIDIEHEADAQEREIRRWLVREQVDQRQVLLLRELSRAIESATDAHAHAGQMLRTYLLEEVMT